MSSFRFLRTFRRRRFPTEWYIRGGLALLAVFAGSMSGAYSLAYAIRHADPARAYMLAPHDPRSAALLARKLSGPEASIVDRQRADRLARAALIRDPTVVAGVTTLGLNAQIRGDLTTARRMFAYSDQLSRRDLMTRLWLIEDAVGRNDIAGALHHYDIALRTSRDAPALLYPVLASASNDAAVAQQLVRTLARVPAWTEGFIGFLAANTTDPAATARLFRALSNVHVTVSSAASAAVIKALAASGRWNEAWTYYRSIRPSATRDHSRDPRFAAVIENPSLFDWQPLSNNAGVTATIEHGESGGVFDFTAPASVGGAVLQQAQLLPSGIYVLEGHSLGIQQATGDRPYWVLNCSDGREVARVEMPNSAEQQGNFTGRLKVDRDCPVQKLQLVVRASSLTAGVSGQIDRVIIRPFSGQ